MKQRHVKHCNGHLIFQLICFFFGKKTPQKCIITWIYFNFNFFFFAGSSREWTNAAHQRWRLFPVCLGSACLLDRILYIQVHRLRTTFSPVKHRIRMPTGPDTFHTGTSTVVYADFFPCNASDPHAYLDRIPYLSRYSILGGRLLSLCIGYESLLGRILYNLHPG
jgi:hypothetical protein